MLIKSKDDAVKRFKLNRLIGKTSFQEVKTCDDEGMWREFVNRGFAVLDKNECPITSEEFFSPPLPPTARTKCFRR